MRAPKPCIVIILDERIEYIPWMGGRAERDL